VHTAHHILITIFWTPHTGALGDGSLPVGFRGKALVGGLMDEPLKLMSFYNNKIALL